MTAPVYRFSASPGQNLLEISMSGFWDVAAVDRYEEARRVAFADMAAHGCPPEKMLVLVDRAGQPVQTAEVVAKLNGVVIGSVPVRRTAVVVGSTLHKLQAERIGDPTRASVFTDRTAAMTWLFDAEP